MADYRNIFNTSETQNWFKSALAVLITRDGLVNLVNAEIGQLQQELLQGIIKNNNLPPGSKCTDCKIQNALPCPTRAICQIRKGRCGFHTGPYRKCPNKICNNLRLEIENEHRFNGPSWKNTDSSCWCTCPWEIAKCFMPPDGYSQASSVAETDFNGVISVLINCKRFDNIFADDLSKDANICTKAREVGRSVRHCSDMKSFGAATTIQNIETLVDLLTDLKQQDETVTEVIEKLNKLKTDTLVVTTADIDAVQTENAMSQEIKELKTQMEEMALEQKRERIEEENQHYEKLKIGLKNELVNFYRDTQSTIPLSPLIPEIDDNLDKFYVPLELRNVKLKKPIHMYKDMFYNDKSRNRNIYIQGDAGMGKSTFCTKLALSWCEIQSGKVKRTLYSRKKEQVEFSDTCILSEFQFVFALALRDASGTDCEIEEMIRNQIINELPGHGKYSDAFVQTILERESCLIVLDGLDEWSHPSKDHFPCRHKLSARRVPHRKSWNQCTIITTTRPWKLNEARLKDSEIDVLLAVTGIANSDTFTKNVLMCLDEKNNKSTCFIHFNMDLDEHGLDDFLEIPVVHLQLICLWHAGRDFGESRCEIYSNMVDMLFGRVEDRFVNDSKTENNANSTNELRCFRNTKHCQREAHFLRSLGKLAFNTLYSIHRESTLVFSDTLVAKHMSETQSQMALDIGIISQHRSHSLTERKSTYCFLHKTFQEFLAAYYLSTNAGEQESDLQTAFQAYKDTASMLDISELFIFICGMNPDLASRMSTIFMEKFDSLTTEDTLIKECSEFQSDIIQATRLMEEGREELVKNGHSDVCLSQYHFVTCFRFWGEYGNEFDAENQDRRKLNELDHNKIVVCVVKRCQLKIPQIQMFVTKFSDSLTRVVLWSVAAKKTFRKERLDLSACKQLQYFWLHNTEVNVSKVLDVKINKYRLVTCVLSGVLRPNVAQNILLQLTNAPLLTKIIIENKIGQFFETNLSSVLQKVVPTLRNFRSLFWRGTRRVSISCSFFPNSIENIMIRGANIPVSSFQEMLVKLLKLSHEVQCHFDVCFFTPVDEFDDFIKRMLDSELLAFFDYEKFGEARSLQFLKRDITEPYSTVFQWRPFPRYTFVVERLQPWEFGIYDIFSWPV